MEMLIIKVLTHGPFVFSINFRLKYNKIKLFSKLKVTNPSLRF